MPRIREVTVSLGQKVSLGANTFSSASVEVGMTAEVLPSEDADKVATWLTNKVKTRINECLAEISGATPEKPTPAAKPARPGLTRPPYRPRS